MKKVYRELTEDQRQRGVIFSSTLSKQKTEQPEDTVHEVFDTDEDGAQKIRRLLDDSFFDESPWSYNVVRR